MITEADIQNKVTDFCREYDIIGLFGSRVDLECVYMGNVITKLIGYLYYDEKFEDFARDLDVSSIDWSIKRLSEIKKRNSSCSAHNYGDRFEKAKKQYMHNYFVEIILESYDLLLAEYKQDMKEGEYDV